MSTFLLGLDTTGSRLTLGLNNFVGLSRTLSLPLGRALSTDLHFHLQEFIEPQRWQDLEAIAVIVGPGSYTGSRLGVVTARTLAQSLEIPLYGFSSLAIASVISAENSGAIALSIPAQRNHVYGAIYDVTSPDVEPSCLQKETNPTYEKWVEQLAAFSPPIESIEFEYTDESSVRMVTCMMAIAKAQFDQGCTSHWSDIVPNYAK